MTAWRRGRSGRWRGWWHRVVAHFRWDDSARAAEAESGPGAMSARPSAGPHASHASHASLDQLLQRAADRRTQRGDAPG
jgi:hypothetical protein